MKKWLLGLLVVVLLPVSAMAVEGDNAQDGYRGHPGRHGHRMENMVKDLGLSAEQSAKFEAINKEFYEKFKALHEEKHKQIEALLNKDQLAKYQDLKKQFHEKWRNKEQSATPPAATPAQ